MNVTDPKELVQRQDREKFHSSQSPKIFQNLKPGYYNPRQNQLAHSLGYTFLSVMLTYNHFNIDLGGEGEGSGLSMK